MRPDRADSSLGSGRRGQSFSSEVPSQSGHAILSPPSSVNPEPAYVAISAASQLVSSELDTDGVTISPSALAQLNGFLDHVLFNILLAAKSTRLFLLKPAIYNVLKPRLGRAALYGADEELREFLGDEEDEDEDLDPHTEQEVKGDFDLELAWKLARLRCMVYSRIGDLEEDDEDEYIERENLDERGGRPRRFSSHPSRVTTASAIFLTSVLEYLAEQALAYAAQATQRKLSRSRASQDTLDATTSTFSQLDRVVVSDADMRHLGRDSPLQKLWRGWRHQVRLPTDPVSRPMSPESLMITNHTPKASVGVSDDMPESEMRHERSFAEVLQADDPAWVPLPMTDNDIDEIEVPGLESARDEGPMAKMDRSTGDERSRKPKSLELSPVINSFSRPFHPDGKMFSPETTAARPTIQSRKSRSLPSSPALDPHPVVSNFAAFNSSAAGSYVPRRSDQVAGLDQYSSREDSERPSDISHVSSANGLLPGNAFSETTAMPGTHHSGQAVGGTDLADEVDIPVRHAEDVSNPSVLPRAEQSHDGVGTTVPAGLMSMHENSTAEPLPVRAHPPRTSSKSPNGHGPHGQERAPALVGNNFELSQATQGHSTAPPLPVMQDRQLPSQRSLSGASHVEAQKRQGQVIFPNDSQDMRFRSDSKSSSHTKSSSSSSKLLGFDREQQSAMQSGSERAGVQRIYPVYDVHENSEQLTRPGTSHSVKEKRPGTASTHMSSLRPGTSGRASVDTAGGSSKAQKSSMEQDEKKQSLENLIRSKETWKYTLTPQNMREIEAPDSPRHKTQTQELADFFRDTVPPGHVEALPVGQKPRSPVEGMNGLRANPPEPMTVPQTPSTSVVKARPGNSEQHPPTSPAAKSFRSQHKARDPIIERPSTRDLADFAKSTGPENPGQLSKPVSANSTQPKRTNSAVPRFQARDPVVKGASSDLIDFIREGPPRAKGDGAHRIPRTVAPFRNTMDSDDINALGPPPDPAGRTSGSSNRDGSIVTKSTVNSRTGLIDSTNRTPVIPANSSNYGAGQAPKRTMGGQAQPKRKQRRVRDPYAIDIDSDDEIENVVSKPPKYEEESLMDFLRNTSPPPNQEHQPQPLLLSTNQMALQGQKMAKKPASSGFRERLKRTTSTNSLNRLTGSRPAPGPSSPSHNSVRSGTPVRPPSPHLSKSGSRFDSYKPTQTTYAAHVERNRQKAAGQGLDDGRDEGSLSKFFSRKRRVAL